LPESPFNPLALLRLIRPHQWVKSAFVVLGPLYGLRDIERDRWPHVIEQALIAAGVFALASSACYIFNDLKDAQSDRNHPRKRNRPIASGAVSPALAVVTMAVLLAGAGTLSLLLSDATRPATLVLAGLYVANVLLYSAFLKHIAIADVLSLSLGFVLRVVGGCVAAAIMPSTWLLNCTLFLAMFLAFSKRLGERRTAEAGGYDASAARSVQSQYTDELLRMSVVVTSVAALITYAFYVQSRESQFDFATALIPAGINWLWISLRPATFALLRSMVLIERGTFDDPTEMFLKDPSLALSAVAFVAVTLGVIAAGML
jgi:4-hydroxybenzoate polyprenyltransferase